MKLVSRKSAIMMALICILISCENPYEGISGNEPRMRSFINLDSLLNIQPNLLSGTKLSKAVLLDGEREKLLLIPDSSMLMSDLNLFKDIDLNQSAFLDSYSVAKQGNYLNFNRIGNKGPQKVVLVRNSAGELSNVRGDYYEDNLLFSSLRTYNLNFDPETSKLVNYQFSGYQKLIFRDTVFFKITGEVIQE